MSSKPPAFFILHSFIDTIPPMVRPEIHRVEPSAVVDGGRVTVSGSGFDVRPGHVPAVTLAGVAVRVLRASPRALTIGVPSGLPAGTQPLAVEGVDGATALVTVGDAFATGVHQVDSPVYDRMGRLYATLSGQRGQQTPVSVFRIAGDGTREPLVTGLSNATSLAVDAEDRLYVSSRFEGTVSRVAEDGGLHQVASDLGVACGLAFGSDGHLYVGDRSGTVFRINSQGKSWPFATLPASIAAFHLAMGPEDALAVAAPTLNSCDAVYRVSHEGIVSQWLEGFGRPQGLAFDTHGTLHVVDALAGDSGVYRVSDGRRELVLSGAGLIGIAFDPTDGTMTVCTDETIYRIVST